MKEKKDKQHNSFNDSTWHVTAEETTNWTGWRPLTKKEKAKYQTYPFLVG